MNNQVFSIIWILVIIVIILVGGILTWQYWLVPKEEAPEVKMSGGQTMEIKVYFHNNERYHKLQEEICPGDYCPGKMHEIYGIDDCNPIFPVMRQISKPKTEVELIELVLKELSKGPIEKETEQGFFRIDLFLEMIKDFELKNGTLEIRLDREKIKEWEKEISPRVFESLSSCEWRGYTEFIVATLKQLPQIKAVYFDPSPM